MKLGYPSLKSKSISHLFRLLALVIFLAKNLNRFGYGVRHTDFLDVRGHFFLDLLVACFVVWWLSGVHFVHAYNQLFDAEREGEQGVLTRLSVLTDARLELASTGCHNQHGAVSLGTKHHQYFYKLLFNSLSFMYFQFKIVINFSNTCCQPIELKFGKTVDFR